MLWAAVYQMKTKVQVHLDEVLWKTMSYYMHKHFVFSSINLNIKHCKFKYNFYLNEGWLNNEAFCFLL